MLALSRKPGEKIIITTEAGERIEIEIGRKTCASQVHLRFHAPRSVTVDREEVHLRKMAEGALK